MKAFSLLALLYSSAAWTQSAPPLPSVTPPVPQAPVPQMDAPKMPNLPDEAVIAILGDGSKFTMGDFKKIYAVLPPGNQQMALRSPETFLHQWEMMRKLTAMAEKSKLAEESPYKEALQYARMNVLAQGEINAAVNALTIDPGEIVKTYDTNRKKYTQVRVKAIYIAFSDDASGTPAGGKKPLTEAEAKAKAGKLLTAIRGGADFAKLAKENSDDETSRDKGGDFATLRFSDNIPDLLRAAVFALKAGEVTEPLKQPNGFYLLRAEEVTVRPLSEVRDEIYNDLKNAQSTDWLNQVDREAKVEILSPEFGAKKPAAGK
jgi:peptidyl-prolyl cis-trans isomerase C